MYESYWSLRYKPFQSRCAPDALFQSQSLMASLLRLRYCFDNSGGLAVLLGESGMGKTSLLRTFASETDRWSPFVHVLYCGLQPTELLRVVGTELCAEIPPDAVEPPGQDRWLQHIRKFLQQSADRGRAVIIAFDDAHQLADESLLGTVAPLLTLAESSPLIRLSVVLAGHPELLPRLQRHRPIAERAEILSVMQSWSRQETGDYIKDTLSGAGASRPVFSANGVDAVFEWSAGNPRRINRLCDLALLVGCAERCEQITAREVEAVSNELLSQAA